MTSAYPYCLLLALGLSFWVWKRRARTEPRLLVIYLGAVLGGFTGAKLSYLAAEGWQWIGHPSALLQWCTGKSILGGLLGGWAGVEIAKWVTRYPNSTGDRFVALLPLAIILGRVGCLLHGCCLGRVCEPHWYALPDASGIPRWPAVPLEIAFNLAAILGLWLLRRRGWLPGIHFYLYLIAYGLFRFVHEWERATPVLFGRWSGYQWLAVGCVAAGIIGILKTRRSPNPHVRIAG